MEEYRQIFFTVTLKATYKADEAAPLVACASKHCNPPPHTPFAWHHANIKQVGGFRGPSTRDLWQAKQIAKRDRSQDKMPTLHMQRVTFLHSYSESISEWGSELVLISLCSLAVSPPLPFQMPEVRPDWQCSGERLSAKIFLPHEVSICCTWQAAGSTQFACLVKFDTDKTRLGENWHTEENPWLQQIFDDVIFAGMEMEADVDICVRSA